jgi:broad specificity phosphatase PhoE
VFSFLLHIIQHHKFDMETPTSTYLTFIRHGQSRDNAGECKTEPEKVNADLSGLGQEQAAKLRIACDLVILSPLRRALHTYALSSIHSIQSPIVSPLFREERCGMVDAMEHEVKDGKCETETKAQFYARIVEATKSLVDKSHLNHVIVIAHYGTILAITQMMAYESGGRRLTNADCVTYQWNEGRLQHVKTPVSHEIASFEKLCTSMPFTSDLSYVRSGHVPPYFRNKDDSFSCANLSPCSESELLTALIQRTNNQIVDDPRPSSSTIVLIKSRSNLKHITRSSLFIHL